MINSGTFVKPTYMELTGNLKPVFERLIFNTHGPRHQNQRLLVFGSIVKSGLSDDESRVYFISMKEKYNAEKYPVSHNCFTTVRKAMEAEGWLSVVPKQIAKDGLARRWQINKALRELVVDLDLEFEDLKPERERKAKHQLVEVRRSTLAKYLRTAGYKLPTPTHTEEDLDRLRDQMFEINELASKYKFEGLLTGKQREPKSFS